MKACGPQKQWEDSPKTRASGHHPHDMRTCMCWHVQHTCIHMCRLQLSLEISPCLQFAQYFYCNLLMGTPKGPNYHDCKLKNECKCKIKRGEERQILIFLSGKNSWVEDKTATSPLQSTLENRFSHTSVVHTTFPSPQHCAHSRHHPTPARSALSARANQRAGCATFVLHKES